MTLLARLALVFSIFFFFIQSAYSQEKIFGLCDSLAIGLKKNVSIVYAGQNLKEPASMFGHTFLVFHDEELPGPDSVVLEFLGNTSNDLFAQPKALFLSIPGFYKISCFFYKMKEYESENRDLWVYTLNFDRKTRIAINEQIKKRIGSEYPYNFIGKNCSYYISSIIWDSLEQQQDITLGGVIPIRTVRRHEKNNYITKRNIFPSSRRKAIYFQNKQNNKCEISGNADLNKTDCNKANAAAINFFTPREISHEKREDYFKLKKKFRTDLQLVYDDILDPLEGKRERSLGFIYSSKSKNKKLFYRPALRDFFTTQEDGIDATSLQVSSIVAEVSPEFKITNFYLLKIENFQAENTFIKGFTNYIDISYSDWREYINSSAKEAVFRIGLGKAVGRSVNFSFTPYIGVRTYKTRYKEAWGPDLGLKINMFQWILSKIRYQVYFTKYFYSPFIFSNILGAKVCLFDWKQISAGFDVQTFDLDTKKLYTDFSITFSF